MRNWTPGHCQALLEALGESDAQSALDRIEGVLHDWGIRPADTPNPPFGFSIECQGATLFFQSEGQLPDEALAFVSSTLALAHQKAAQQEALSVSKERSAMLSDAAFEGLLIHVDGFVIDVNDRLMAISGYGREELLGLGTFQRCVAPEDRAEVVRRIQGGFEGAYVIQGVRRDGSHFPAELQSKQGRLGSRPVRVVAVRDVTQRENMLRLLRESEERLQVLAGTVFDMTVLSQDGVIVAAEGKLFPDLGYTLEELRGEQVLRFIAAPTAPLVQQKLLEGGTGAYAALVLAKNGEQVPVEIVAVESTLEGQPVRMAGIRDQRAEKTLQDDRQKLQHRIEQAERLESLGILAGGVAHDFNNLLTSIMGDAEHLLLDAKSRPAEAAEIVMLEGILRATDRAADLTQRLLAYAGRGEVGPPKLLDLGAMLQELRHVVSRNGAGELSLELAVDSQVIGDRTTLTQVFLNLLTNAADATSENGGTIHVRTRRVRQPDESWDTALGAEVGPGNWILVEVEDEGSGMDQSTLSRIFDPFFTTKEQGHGLGLAACLGIVRSHGGALRVTSEPGNGTHFSVLLPVHGPGAAPSAKQSASSPDRRRVLIVDDEPTVRSQLKRSLRLRGYTVLEADDGAACLAQVAAQPPDLILLDMSMPKMDGAEVIHALRRNGSPVPIVVMSGYMSQDQEKNLAQGSFQAFVRKPFGVTELLSAVEQALSAA